MQAIEEKIGSAGKFVKDKIQDATGLALNDNNSPNMPSFSSGGGISSEERRIL